MTKSIIHHPLIKTFIGLGQIDRSVEGMEQVFGSGGLIKESRQGYAESQPMVKSSVDLDHSYDKLIHVVIHSSHCVIFAFRCSIQLLLQFLSYLLCQLWPEERYCPVIGLKANKSLI